MNEKLNKEQLQAVKECLESGGKLVDIQKLLVEKFDVNMTYMDVRFLIDDLDLSVKDPTPPPEKAEASSAIPPSLAEPTAESVQPLGGVQVELSPVVRPGMIAGGSVIFSDGINATWELDQEGRLRLGGAAPDYRPSEIDLSDFQRKLRELLGA